MGKRNLTYITLAVTVLLFFFTDVVHAIDEEAQLPTVSIPAQDREVGLITNPDTDKIKDIVLTSGAYLPGRIPHVFETRAHYTNTSDQVTRYVVPDGMVFLTKDEPLKHQFVVVLEGIRVTLKPGQSLTDLDGMFWTMCVERKTATPPLNMRLVPAGILPSYIIDEMNTYKWMTNESQSETRERVINMINESVLAHLGIQR